MTYYSSSDIPTSIEDDESSSLDDPALTLSCFKFSYDIPLDEQKDAELFIPDGVNISFVGSNFKKLVHDDWEDVINPVKKRKTNQGRKSTKKTKKQCKKNNGSGEKFDSSIDFGVIHEGKSYSIKVFRVDSCTFPSNSYDKVLCETLLNKLFTFINESKPGSNIKLIGSKVDLKNMKYQYNLSRYSYMENPTINLTKFKRYVVGEGNKICFDNEIITLYFNNQQVYMKGVYNDMSSGNKKPTCNQFKLRPDGSMFVFGCKDSAVTGKIARIIFSLITYLSNQSDPRISSIIQNGYQTKSK